MSSVLKYRNDRAVEMIMHGRWGEPDRYRLLAVDQPGVEVWLETDLYTDEAAALLADHTLDVGLAGREVLVSLSVDGRELWKGYYTAAPWPEDPDPVRDLVGALVTSMDGYDRHRTSTTDRAINILVDWLGY